MYNTNNKNNQNVQQYEGMKSHVVLTIVLLLNAILILCCYQINFKNDMKPWVFYIYVVVALIYIVLAGMDALMHRKHLFVYKLVMTLLCLASSIALIVVYNIV